MMGIGDQVVCIYDNWHDDPYFEDRSRYITSGFPVKGGIYTIRNIFDYSDTEFYRGTGEKVIGLIFEELVNVPFHDHNLGREVEASWISVCFKPVKKTNIDCFKGLLTPTPSKKIEKVCELELT